MEESSRYPGERAKVMGRWQAARAQLGTAVQAFRDASGALDHDLTRSASSRADFLELETNFRTILAELPGIAEDDRKLNDTYTNLKVAINTSKTVAPISRLPVDILSRIFAILVGWDDIYCAHGLDNEPWDWNIYALTLSGVSAAWRRIMINTPSFWSHIDIRLGLGGWDPKHERYTRMCIERVTNPKTHIHLHISCEISLYHKLQIPKISRLPALLCDRPIASLKLLVNQQFLVKPIFLAWLRSSNVNLDSLKFEMRPSSGILDLLPWEASFGYIPTNLSHESRDPHLRHLRTLSLTGAHIEWHLVRFSGLVDLELSYIEDRYCPPLSQLREMLSSSPEIRTLRFSHVKIRYAYGLGFQMEMAPIRLPRLTFLGLDELDLSTLMLLLQVIEPGTGFEVLNVSYGNSTYYAPEHSDFVVSGAVQRVESIGPFCLRHKVPMLSIHIPTFDKQEVSTPVARLLSSLTDLRTLNLSGVELATKDSIDLLCAQPESAHPSEIIPLQRTLRRLRLRNTTISLSGLRRILSTYSITWLRLDGCRFCEEDIVEDDPSSGERSGCSELPDDFREWLQATVPEVYVDPSCEPEDKHMQTSGGLPWWLWST